MEKTLKEHLAEARAKRWAQTSEDRRKEHSAKMNAARWGKRATTNDQKPVNN